jgi:hypothetical protein
MSKSSDRTQPDETDSPGRAGGVDAGRDLTAGGDVVGRDKITAGGDVAGRDVVKPVTVVGYSPQAVQRLVITVAAIVFVTAACFFSGGIFIGSQVFTALDRPVPQSQVALRSMQSKIEAASNTPKGETLPLTFSEEELTSYVGWAGPQIGLNDAKARLLDTGQVAVGGRLQALGNLPIAATFSVQPNTDKPFQLESVAAKVLPVEGTFGWVAVPNVATASLADQAAQLLGGGYTITGVQAAPGELNVVVQGK